MAKKKKNTRRKKASTSKSPKSAAPPNISDSSALRGIGLEGRTSESALQRTTTGRMLVVSLEPSTKESKAMLRAISGATGLGAASSAVCCSEDFGASGIDIQQAGGAEVVLLSNLGVALLQGDVEQNQAAVKMAARVGGVGLVVEPEYINFNLGHPSNPTVAETVQSGGPTMDPDTHRALMQLLARMTSGSGLHVATQPLELGAAADCFYDTPESTWGLKATHVLASAYSGTGIRVAVLDSGMDLAHADFAQRPIQHAVFVPPNQPDNQIHDVNGHGTHCIGTSCGPQASAFGPRYGIAHRAEIFAGKVLAHDYVTGGASGGDFGILSGIDWALTNKCHIISMSFGAPVSQPEYPQSYENAASRALAQDCLVIAASGNDSNRPGYVAPVARPANCPSIAATAAVDHCLRIYQHSNGRRFVHNGAEVNLSGPGVDVLSSVPRHLGNTGYMTGTSMATPHAAGIAALVAEQTGLRAMELYQAVKSRCQNLGDLNDFGFGLVRVEG